MIKPIMELMIIFIQYFIDLIHKLLYWIRLYKILKTKKYYIIKEHFRFGDFLDYKYGIKDYRNEWWPKNTNYFSPFNTSYFMIADTILGENRDKDKLALFKFLGSDLYLEISERLWLDPKKVKSEIVLLSLGE